jgi:hypothetical protein
MRQVAIPDVGEHLLSPVRLGRMRKRHPALVLR